MIYSTNIERFYKYMDESDIAQLREYSSMSQMWADCLEKFADRVAIEDDGKQFTYSDIENAASALRGVLNKNGCTKNERIGLFSDNSIDFVVGYIAITTFGCAAVVLPPHLPAQAVAGCAMQFGLKTIVCSAAKKEMTEQASAACGAKVICTEELGEEKCGITEVKPEDPCTVIFTGGTTGKSKGALLSNGAVMQGVLFGQLGLRGVFGSRYLLCLPLSHVFGLIRNLLTSLSTGSTLFICRNTQDLFRDIAMFRPTILILVPALAEMALALSKKFNRNMLGDALKTIICGAAAVPPYLVEEYSKYGISLYPGYGLTESSNLVSGNPESLERPSSVGLPYPNQELRFENGELWLRGKNMMECYLGAAEEAFTEDGWFKTGDLAHLDEDGFLYITGRIKEIIVLPSGENISPAELEARYLENVRIQDCQVFEDIIDGGRHILALEVVPRASEMAKLPADEAAAILTRELEEINATFPAFQRVSRIVIRDTDFERTKSMKIVRYQKCK